MVLCGEDGIDPERGPSEVNTPLPTAFLPAERSSSADLQRGADVVHAQSSFREALQLVPNLVVVLDSHRQIVFANNAALAILGGQDLRCLVGMRTGEAMGCVHHDEGTGGCGTTASCRYCGAANAVRRSQQGEAATEECRLKVRRDGQEEAMDLRIWATPVEMGGETFTLFTAIDIAEEKRKNFLEKIFLHDIMNTASALRGFSTLLGMEGDSILDRSELVQRVGVLSERIVDEINAHRILLAAEANELVVQVRDLSTSGALETVRESFDRPDYLEGRHLAVSPGAADIAFTSDPTLLLRVLSNMTKNALEASLPGETVVMDCEDRGDQVAFLVRNPAYMPEKIRLQIFNRSFSTKGNGRGLGTYSMKYLTEKYLGGRISFTSTEADGTEFVAVYPLVCPHGPHRKGGGA